MVMGRETLELVSSERGKSTDWLMRVLHLLVQEVPPSGSGANTSVVPELQTTASKPEVAEFEALDDFIRNSG